MLLGRVFGTSSIGLAMSSKCDRQQFISLSTNVGHHALLCQVPIVFESGLIYEFLRHPGVGTGKAWELGMKIE